MEHRVRLNNLLSTAIVLSLGAVISLVTAVASRAYNRRVEITSERRVTEAAGEVTQLLREGVHVRSAAPEYTYTKVGDASRIHEVDQRSGILQRTRCRRFTPICASYVFR